MTSVICSFILLMCLIAVSLGQYDQHSVGMFPASQYRIPVPVAKTDEQVTFKNSNNIISSAVEQPTGQPSSQPTTQPTSVQPSSQPSTQPSMLPSTQPTSQPSVQPSSQPSTQPSILPNTQPTSQPSSQPSMVTSTQPTSVQPSSQPSTQPSMQPSIEPSGEPSGQPTSQPTSQPSGQPSSYPTRGPTKYEEPTSAPSGQPSSQPFSWPTTAPSRQPFSAPSSQPTKQPSTQPTRSPLADPTSLPTSQPSSRPTSMPSYSPSSMPTPGGNLAVNWWYLVSSRCEITADDLNTYSNAEILDSVVSAFAFVLTDPLNDVERETVEVSAELITSSANRAENSMTVQPKAVAVNVDSNWVVRWSTHTQDERYRNAVEAQDRSGTDTGALRRVLVATQSRAYFIEAWCPDHPTALKVYQAMERVASTPSEIIEPLHEHGLHEVSNATISNIALSTTTDLPPSLSTDSLSPVRITWIILGTIAVFAIGLFLLSRVKYLKYLYCSKTCIEDMLRSWYNILADGCMMCLRSVGLVSSDLHLYYGSGFDLTTQEEEADFYGEHRGNLPSDNLDIHYGGDKRNQRSTYLEDDEDGHGGKKAGVRSGIGKLFTRLRGQRDAPPVPPTPPTRHSPDSHSIELSSIHNNNSFSDRNKNHNSAFSTRNETVVSPLTTRFSSNPSYAASTGSPFQIRSVGYGGSRLPADMYRPVGDDMDDIGGFSPVMSANSSSHNSKHDSKDYESFVV